MPIELKNIAKWFEDFSTLAPGCSLEVVTMAANQDAPPEFQVFPFGQVTGQQMTPFIVDDVSVESCRAFQRYLGRDMVIDYEHQTLSGQQAPAAGWIKEFFSKGGGLCCRAEWTPKAKEFIKNKEYRYFSPIALLDEDRHLLAINTMALTNNPRGNHLRPLIMKAASAYVIQSNLEKEEPMLKKLLELLGLPAETTEDKVVEAMTARLKLAANQEVMAALNLQTTSTAQEVMSAINKLKENTGGAAPACVEVMTELGLSANSDKSSLVATIRALKQSKENGINPAEFEAMKAKIADQEASALVTEAMKAGKITAAQKDWAHNYAKTDQPGFRLFVEKAPIVISMKAAPAETLKKDSQDITPTDIEVMKQMGLSVEDFKKYYKPPVIQ